MDAYEITLQDENHNLHNLKKIKDSIYDSVKKIETEQGYGFTRKHLIFLH